MDDRRASGEEIHGGADRPLPDDQRPGSDMGTAYEDAERAGEVHESDASCDASREPTARPSLGDVYRSGS